MGVLVSSAPGGPNSRNPDSVSSGEHGKCTVQNILQSRKTLHSLDDNGIVSLSVTTAMTQAVAGEGEEGEQAALAASHSLRC